MSAASDDALIGAKLRVPGRETSIRLEAALWDAYDTICRQIGCNRHALASRIEVRRDRALGLTNAVRVLLVQYWRVALELYGAEAPTILERALTDIGPKRGEPIEESVLCMRDQLAPDMTPKRMALLTTLAHQHPDDQKFAAAARKRWGRNPPWDDQSDGVAGQALRDLLRLSASPPSAADQSR